VQLYAGRAALYKVSSGGETDMRRYGWVPGLLLLGACAGANPYGYGREYLPADDEEGYYERAQELSYEEVRRNPQAYASELLGWFGVVTKIDKRPSGEAVLALELKFHQPRHLCRDQFDSSCRVTISERAGGAFTTTVQLPAEQHEGFGSTDWLNVGSLVKVYGAPTGEYDERGGPVIKTEWYRYWPHAMYVTTTGNATMRR
jgi:hypothetical protein